MDRLEELLEESRQGVLRHQLKLSWPIAASARIPRRKGRVIAASGAIAAGALLVAGFTNPQLLNIGKGFNLLKNQLLSPEQVMGPVQLGYGQAVNQSVTSHGITLTIGNVYADSTKLAFDMVESFTSGQISRPVIRDEDMHLDIDGTRKLRGLTGGDFQEATGHRYAGVVYFPVGNDQPYELLPTQFVLHVHVSQIGNIQGNWDFSIPVSWQKLSADTKVFHPHVQVTDNGSTLQVQDISVGPTQTILHCTWSSSVNSVQPERMLIVDDHGHLIGGPIVSRSTSRRPNGTQVTTMTIAGGGSPDSASAKLYVTPLFERQVQSVQLTGHYPVTLNINPDEPIKITGVEFDSNKTLVHLEMDGARYKEENTYQGQDLLSQYGLAWNDSSASSFVGSTAVNIDDKNPNEAVVVFPKVDPGKVWSLQVGGFTPQSGLTVAIPMK